MIWSLAQPPRTQFDRLKEQRIALDGQIERFEEKEDGIREAARATGQRKARRHLKKVSPYFFGEKIDLQDVKLLFDPVEYLVFRGLKKGNCLSVEFVDHPPETKEREIIQASLDSALRAGNIEWQTFQVQDTGRIVPETTCPAAKRAPVTPRGIRLPTPKAIPLPTILPLTDAQIQPPAI